MKKEKVTLKRIWLDQDINAEGEVTFQAIRIDWSNDRHGAVQLNSLSAEDVKEALLDTARFIYKEMKNGKI